MSNSLSTLESLVQRYERNATLRALVQLVPLSIGSAIDSAVLTRMQNFRENRARELFDELQKGNVELHPELLESNDFLHCFSITAEAVLKTHQAEKIRALARLLDSSTVTGNISNVSEYEELLNILVELSERELRILSTLATYETKYPNSKKDNELQNTEQYWGEFVNQITAELDIQHNEVDALMTRITRSACYETYKGHYPLAEPGGKGKLTPVFQRLKSLALENY